jgi:putative NADH-flavin reductase
MSPIKVLLVGASGETGSSILNGLLEDGNFVRLLSIYPHQTHLTICFSQDVTALVRAESASTSKLCERDLRIVEADLLGPQERLVQMLTGIDVVISAIHYANNNDQIPLATAAKEAGVKRFVPCGFITVAPPRGVMRLRDQVSLLAYGASHPNTDNQYRKKMS